MTRDRVLLIAEAANPTWTSVPLVGWSHARALFDVADVHLVTQIRNAEAIRDAGLREGTDFTAIDSERFARPWWLLSTAVRRLTGMGWTFSLAMATVSYYYFESLLWRRFRKAIREHRYDIVHRLTPLSPTTPSIIAPRCAAAGVPFVLGPLNGGVPWPPGFQQILRQEGEWLHYVRSAYKLAPGYRGTRRGAAAIIAGSRATLEELPEYVRSRTVYVPENGIDMSLFKSPVSGPVREPLRVAWVGRLVPYKGADMLIEATADLMRKGLLRLDIIGDGPQRTSLVELIERLGVRDHVRLDGAVEHDAVPGRLAESDVFGFPSVREFGGGVVLEAMALGLVPVVADYAGPAELVTPEVGIRVPFTSRDDLVKGFRREMERLVTEEPEEIRSMGARARERVERLFTWPAKARQTAEIYSWVLNRAPKPDFGMPMV